jgi:enoyl-CoA hydratase/carnithine racemase
MSAIEQRTARSIRVGPLASAEMQIGPYARRKALLDLVLTGRRVKASEAAALGLVTRVVGDDVLDGEIDSLCTVLAGLSPAALRMGKEAIYEMTEMNYHAAMRYLREVIALASRTDDATEGIRSFFEKRKPVWTGH